MKKVKICRFSFIWVTGSGNEGHEASLRFDTQSAWLPIYCNNLTLFLLLRAEDGTCQTIETSGLEQKDIRQKITEHYEQPRT